MSRPGCAGHRRCSTRPRDLLRGRPRRHRTAAGQQVGQAAGVQRAALAGPARDPGQPGAGAVGEPGRRRQRAGAGGQPFADQDDRPGFGSSASSASPSSAAASPPGRGGTTRAASFVRPAGGERRDGDHLQAVLAGGLAQPQEHDRRFLLGLESGQQHHRCGLQVGVADGIGRPATRAARNSASSAECGRAAEVDVVGAQHDSGELGVGVGVLDGDPAADQHAGAPPERRQPARPPRRAPPTTTPAAARRRRRAPAGVVIRSPMRGVGEGPAALVAVPLLVDLRVVAGQPAQHHAAAVVGALGAARRAVLAHAGAGHQVERAGPEPVGGAGQRADRADLHGVAAEVGVERLAGAMPTCCSAPRSSSSMNGSPAI